jgi:hypothetical protein
VATTADGKTLTTVGAGKGKVLFDSFTFDATIVQVKNGAILMPADPRISDGHMPHLRIGVVGHSDVSADLDIPVRYDAFKAGNDAYNPAMHQAGAVGRFFNVGGTYTF